MKKILALILTLIMTLSMSAMAANNIEVEFDGEKIEFEMPPRYIDGTLMLPARAIFEKLGATIEWTQATQTATVIKENTVAVIGLDSPIMRINDKSIVLDLPACIVDDVMLVPMRAISEVSGNEIYCNGEENTVVITRNKAENIAPLYDEVLLYKSVTEPMNFAKNYFSSVLASQNLRDASDEMYNTVQENSTYAFAALRNLLLCRGEDKNGECVISHKGNDMCLSLSYNSYDDNIVFSIKTDSMESVLILRQNENMLGLLKFKMGEDEYLMLYEYINASPVTVYKTFSDEIERDLRITGKTLELFDTTLNAYSKITVSDFVSVETEWFEDDL